ncbi:hypothetical protein Palpr_1975 [Paludibacter propionicigenes WB4]|uniref:Uncharacterized protein n=2 Tax=Paludibacter TaxID=346096 RepID=E4T5W8_PALPW|nr:hypothetical protein Palpr_1975 [Paludibacter propionicigenes WB4]
MKARGLLTKVIGLLIESDGLVPEVVALVMEVTVLLTEQAGSMTNEVIGLIADVRFITISLRVYKHQAHSLKFCFCMINKPDFHINRIMISLILTINSK